VFVSRLTDPRVEADRVRGEAERSAVRIPAPEVSTTVGTLPTAIVTFPATLIAPEFVFSDVQIFVCALTVM
jgi:hypothetical protein